MIFIINLNLWNFNSINQHVPDGLHENTPWHTKHFPLRWHLSLICFPKQSEIEIGDGFKFETGWGFVGWVDGFGC